MAAVDSVQQCLSFQAETRGLQPEGPNGALPQQHIHASHTEGMPASALTSIMNDVCRCRHDHLLLHKHSQAHVASTAVTVLPHLLGSLVYHQASRKINAKRCSLFFSFFSTASPSTTGI